MCIQIKIITLTLALMLVPQSPFLYGKDDAPTDPSKGDRKQERGIIVTFKNDTQIFVPSWVVWTKGTQGLSLYTPRESAGLRVEVILDDKSRSGTEEILDLLLRDITKVVVKPSGRDEDTFTGAIHLVDGRIVSGTLRGKHWEGKTTIDDLDATGTFMLRDVSEVEIQRQKEDDLRVDGTIHQRDGRQIDVTDLEFQLFRAPPFVGYAGNSGIDVQVDAATSIRIPEKETLRVEFISKYESEAKEGINVRVHRKDGKTIAAPTFVGMKVRGKYLSGNLKGLDTKLRFDNAELVFLRSIERTE